MTLTDTEQKLALAATGALTFVTGIVDAVGFLALDRVFTGNMTGNIVILGMGVAGADDLPVLGPAIALAAFTAAAFVAGLVLRARTKGWQHRVTVLLTLGAVALAALTAVAATAGEHASSAVQIAMAASTAAVMGSQTMVARAVAVADMTTVVVTSTLASLAGETWTRRGERVLFNRRFGAIAGIFAGAVAGALLLRWHIAVPFAVAATLTAAVAVLGHLRLAPRRAELPEASLQ